MGKTKSNYFCCGNFYADFSKGQGCCDGNVFDNRTVMEIKSLRWNHSTTLNVFSNPYRGKAEHLAVTPALLGWER